MDPITDWIIRLGWILVAWLFALGGVVGSFLNVVVYRLPAGKSIVHPGSSCPACGHPIRWYHNLPVLSWLLLRGRCYDCQAKISARYPLVEFVTAALFAAMFLADAKPRMAALAADGNTSLTSGRDIMVRYAGDLWLLCTLWCAALIEFDGVRPPRRIFWTALVVGLLATVFFPLSRISSQAVEPAAIHMQPLETALAVGAVGLIAGLGVGYLVEVALIRRIGSGATSSNNAGSAALTLACVGTFLGWGAAVAVGIAATGAFSITRKMTNPKSALGRFGFSGWALMFTLAWILAAHWLSVKMPLMPDR